MIYLIAVLLLFILFLMGYVAYLLHKVKSTQSIGAIQQVLDSKLLLAAYTDGGATAIKESGDLLVDCIKTIRLILFPFQISSALQDLLVSFLNQTIRKVAPEHRIKPATEILIPIIQKIQYTNNNILKDLYSNLLARAMDKTHVYEAHPGFIFTLCQLSPDEVLIVQRLSLGAFVFVRQWDLDQNDNKKIINQRVIENEFPVETLAYPENFSMYVSHLYHLNVAQAFKKDNPVLDDKRKQIGGIDRYTVNLPEYGQLFVKACVIGNNSHIE
jgi:hypothetical protein